jgi:hypothetical protein
MVWLARPISCRYEPESLQGTVAQGDLTGYYYPAHEFPLAFFYVSRIDLTTADFQVNPDSSVIRTPIRPMGYLITQFDSYKLSNVNIDRGRISFTTESRVGVSYQFTGKVLKEGDYPIRGYSQHYVARTIMVEGRMVQLLFGFKVAEGAVRFTKGFGC